MIKSAIRNSLRFYRFNPNYLLYAFTTKVHRNVLRLDTLSTDFKKFQFMVRGSLHDKALEMDEDL